MQSVIHVDLGERSYDIEIAPDAIDQLGERMRSLDLGKKVLLVSNPVVFRHYGDRAMASLRDRGFEVAHCIIMAGEQYKTLNSIQKIYGQALENQLERSSTMVALGGGVIGDMTGFAAATWLRGMNFIQVPTTLLAMVDASIGGKTGVNHPKGKNLIGAFYQPRLVLIDPKVLKTLPAREFRAGMAEVIKYGVIWDEALFEKMERCDRLDQLRFLPEELLHDILVRSCQSKVDVVVQDEREAGLRAILNYGHTIGHAVESLTRYKVTNHGEAVAIGMVAASRCAVQLKCWDEACDARQFELIEKTGLPTKLPSNLDIEKILETLKTDKKVKDGKVRFILPKRIGEATISDRVTSDLLREILPTLQ